jgi:hypothetical protein
MSAVAQPVGQVEARTYRSAGGRHGMAANAAPCLTGIQPGHPDGGRDQ